MSSERQSARDRYRLRPESKPDHVLTFPLAYVTEQGQGQHASLSVTFIGQRPQTVNVTFLRTAPHLTLAFAAAIAAWGSTGLSDNTRSEMLPNLRRGFIRFLSDKGRLDVTLEEVNTVLLIEFIHWIDQLNTFNGKPVALSYKQSLYGIFKVIFNALQKLETYNAEAKNVLVPPGTWSARNSHHSPTRSMTQNEWEQLFFACVTETEGIILKLKNGWAHMESPSQEGSECTTRDYTQLNECLAELSHHYPGMLPTWTIVQKEHPELWSAARQHGFSKVAEYFHPSADALMPFLLLLAVKTGYNPSTLTGLEWSDVSYEEVFGVERLVLSPFKARSGTVQTWSFRM